jgi:hypothetical protein
MWGRSADWIEHLIANYKVYVCTIRTERIVTGQPQIWTGLPPAVLTANNPISKTSVQVGASPNASPRRRDRYPFVRLDFVQCGLAASNSANKASTLRWSASSKAIARGFAKTMPDAGPLALA